MQNLLLSVLTISVLLFQNAINSHSVTVSARQVLVMAWHFVDTNKDPGFTQEQLQDNAKEVYNQLGGYGWSLNAICGVLGNWQWESHINPGQWQYGHEIGSKTGGYGLGQWTPTGHYLDWCNMEGHDRLSGYWQVYYLDLNDIYYNGTWYGSQWIKESTYNLTWDQFKKTDLSPEDACAAFFFGWERPPSSDTSLPTRQQYARDWYTFLSGEEPPEPGKKLIKNFIWYMRPFIYGGSKRTIS